MTELKEIKVSKSNVDEILCQLDEIISKDKTNADENEIKILVDKFYKLYQPCLAEYDRAHKMNVFPQSEKYSKLIDRLNFFVASCPMGYFNLKYGTNTYPYIEENYNGKIFVRKHVNIYLCLNDYDYKDEYFMSYFDTQNNYNTYTVCHLDKINIPKSNEKISLEISRLELEIYLGIPIMKKFAKEKLLLLSGIKR